MKHKGPKVYIISLLLSISFLLLFIYLLKDTVYTKLKEFPIATVLDNPQSTFFLFLVFILMPLNLYLDFSKWKIQENSLSKAIKNKMIKGYLLGLSIAVITPNRSGEFLGRLFFMPYKKRFRTIIYSLRSSWAQFIVNIVLGLFSLLLFTSAQIQLPFSLIWLYALIILVLALVLLLFLTHEVIIRKILAYRSIAVLVGYLKMSSRTFNKISSLLFSKLILFSLGRYLVYFIQFYFLCIIFSVNLPFYVILSGLATIFLLQMFLPVFSILEIGVKGSLALFVFYNYPEEQFYLILSLGMMWLINVFIPAISGLFLFLITQSYRLWKIHSYQKLQ
ncbi:MAG: hypothetical protein EA412_06210 [Chitinophagaceae bacterium]|nr:MAG: hypothetical protein EA412_06210 [Chitinophagaceae bacterium]